MLSRYLDSCSYALASRVRKAAELTLFTLRVHFPCSNMPLSAGIDNKMRTKVNEVCLRFGENTQ